MQDAMYDDAALLSQPLGPLMMQSSALARGNFGSTVTYSPKVFIPLTKLCRDRCHYCTFSRDRSGSAAPYMSIDEVLAVARAGAQQSCVEALFTLGDKPELRYPKAQEWLIAHGHETTVDYLVAACKAVLDETGLLPHVNAGVLSREEMIRLREVSASMGLMMEICSDRLMEKGGPHYRSPDKAPALRLQMLDTAGELGIPFTTGLLIGIGETREERLQTLHAIQAAHEKHGHVQEVIIQNFCPKPGTPMQDFPAAGLEEQLWTVAVARLILSPEISLQSPPNLRDELDQLLAAGINDLGGISPVTVDHVNPEKAWPEISRLSERLSRFGLALAARLPVYPAYVFAHDRWLDAKVRKLVLRHSDSMGLARDDDWIAGVNEPQAMLPQGAPSIAIASPVESLLVSASKGERLSEAQVASLFAARGDDLGAILRSADAMRQRDAGDVVRYVVNRNINYTNICSYKCGFCAFSKRTGGNKPVEGPYNLDHAEVVQRAREAWDAGATEVCMQGGIHPSYDGNTYLGLLRAVKEAIPTMHVHAFSPLEVSHGAQTLGISVTEFLQELKRAGLGSLPGTAAEILSDDMRAILCPDKLNTSEWLHVVSEAHKVGIRTTSTIMFGSIESPVHWARHLLALRDTQQETGGFTEFVPLAFVHVNSPIYKRGLSRKGPTWRETLLMYAVSRLVFGKLMPNIQTSWVKLGPKGAQATLNAGVNDFGGVLMNESISRAAGASWGQGLSATEVEKLILEMGRQPQQRTTLYDKAPARPAVARRIDIVAAGSQPQPACH